MKIHTKPLRDTKDGPFFWCNAAAAQRLSGHPNQATAFPVYIALCVVASRRKSPEVMATQSEIEKITGLSSRTIRRRLRDLEELGLVQTLQAPDHTLKEANIYRLLAVFPERTQSPVRPVTVSDSNKKTNPMYNNNNKKKEGAASGDALLPFDGLAKPEAKKPDGKSRKRDCAFEALMEIEGYSPGQQLLRSERGKINKVLKEIREVYPDVTGEEIRSRFEQLKRTMPWCKHTATSLVKHWSKCEPVQEEPLNTYQPVRFVMPPRERPAEPEPEKPSREMQEAARRQFDQFRNFIRNLNKNDGTNAN